MFLNILVIFFYAQAASKSNFNGLAFSAFINQSIGVYFQAGRDTAAP